VQIQQTLGIEMALEGAGDAFSEKYRLMKNRLLNVEYEHWAAGFPRGTITCEDTLHEFSKTSITFLVRSHSSIVAL
jgi:hypothetical protein